MQLHPRRPATRLGVAAPAREPWRMLLLATPPATSRRERLARLERPLLLAGLALVTLHLLDLAFSGAATSPLAILGIVALPAAWAALQPRMIRPTRIALAVPVGLLAVGFGVTSHGLHAVHLGPDRYDVTGLLFIAGGLALLASAVVAAAAPRGPRRSLWGLRALVWAGGAVVGLILLLPLGRHRAGHPRAALGDPRAHARRPARGGPHPRRRRPRARGLVDPLPQRRCRAAGPRLRRQPRPRRGARPHARPSRLRRARARPPGQRRERRPLERPRRQRPAGHHHRARLPPGAPRRRPDGGLRRLDGRRGPARGGRARHAPAGGRLRWLGAARGRRQGAAAARHGARGPRRHGSRLAGARRHARRALAHAADVPHRPAPGPARREQRRPGRDPDEPRLRPRRRPDDPAVGAPRRRARRRRPRAARPPTRRAPSASSTARSGCGRASSRGARGRPRTARAAAS